MERKIILIMVLYLVFLGLSGCMAKPKASTKTAEQPNISVYNGTLSQMLGCIFAPSECQKFKKEEPQEKEEVPEFIEKKIHSA